MELTEDGTYLRWKMITLVVTDRSYNYLMPAAIYRAYPPYVLDN